MRLRWVNIEGYKRFEQPSTLYLYGPLVAVVGPNEAGKTSLLDAMRHLTDVEGFDRREYTGREVP